jgi:hypothetical protein
MPGEKFGVCCKECKTDEMVDVVNKKCPCGKQPSFNVPRETFGVCCAKCKTEGMINVVSKKCPCGKQPSFNVSGKNVGVCCVKCKTVEMIDVVHKRCPCGNQPSFNVSGENIGVCCAKCKTNGMVDVVNKRCSCGRRPSFNVSGETVGICCVKCKTDEMVDVVNRKCLCGKQPNFNVPGETFGVCCAKCKTEGMINVVSKICPCGKQPKFNVPGEKIGVCCSKCKTNEMIDVVDKLCPGYQRDCPVRTYVSRGHMYCMSCDPNEARRKLFKRYEESFFDYVKDKIDVHKREFRVTFEPDETSKKFARLDGVVFGDGIIVCLEVDENGHGDYECDEHRMHLVTAELLQKYPDHVVSWVRVNPTIDAKSQWSKKSKMIREKRFEDVVNAVSDILESRETRILYIGFDDV